MDRLINILYLIGGTLFFIGGLLNTWKHWIILAVILRHLFLMRPDLMVYPMGMRFYC